MNVLFGHPDEVITLYGHGVASWALIISYLFLGVGGLRSYTFQKDTYQRDRRFWLILAVTLFFLAVNRLTGVLLDVTAYFRNLAELKTLYPYRRPIQLLAVIEIILLSTMVIRRLRRMFQINIEIRLAIIGLALLVIELSIKTVSFHHLDQIINIHIAYWTLNGFIEVLGIGLIGFAVMLKIHPGLFQADTKKYLIRR